MSAYEDFIRTKRISIEDAGIVVDAANLNSNLFPFQRDIVRWSLRKGRAAIFCDCGLGKTIMQLEFAHQAPGKFLILAPLAVAQQTVREGQKFGIEAIYARKPIDAKITITNYEMLDHFDPNAYNGIVLDESSILKSFAGIGSEGYVAIAQGRKFVGIELKESYFQQALANLKNAKAASRTLFDSEAELSA